MIKRTLVLTLLCGLGATSALHAQDPVTPPPKVLQIIREVIKPGHGPAHTKVEAGWPAAFTKANAGGHYIAMTSTTGPGEALFVAGWDSFAAFEQDGQANEKNAALMAELDRLAQVDGEHLSNFNNVFATYREDLSYRAPVSIPKMRHFSITTYRVKPGRTAEFAAARKHISAVHEKRNMDEHWAVYQVTSGMPAGTFLLIMPLKSMAELDAAAAMHDKAYEDALAAESQNKLGDLMNASLDSSTNMLFSFSPKMSYPPKEWTVADAFWTAPKKVDAPAKALAKAPAK